MNDTIYLIIILFCLIMSAYFSATETAFSTLNRVRVKTLADKGNKRAKLVLKLSDNFDSLLSTILIGNNLVNILMASLSTILFIKWFDEGTGPTISTAVTTIVVLIFGEITPKSIAKERPEKFAMFSAPIIKSITILFFVFNWLFKQWKKLVSLITRSEEVEDKVTEEELISMVKEAEEDGEFDEDEGQIIKSAIEFSDLEIGDIFIPRIDVTAISIDISVDEISKTFIETGYSRIPVYKDNFDNIIGILYYKDFYAAKEKKKEVDIEKLLKPVFYVTKSQKINDVLKEFQTKQTHFGVIVDEFGSIAGIVTLEDILEEIVGEIWDEHDLIELEIKESGKKEYLVSGKTSIVKLMNYLGLDEEVDALTVNGWVMDNIHCIPNLNTEFEWNGFNIKVVKMNGRRIGSIQIIDNRKDLDENSSEEKELDSKKEIDSQV